MTIHSEAGSEFNKTEPEVVPTPPEALSHFAIYVRILTVCTVCLIFIGSLVTTKGAGLAVPDWPLSFGTLFPQMVGGVMFEHGHRLVAGGVGFMTLVLAIWSSYAHLAKPLRRLSWTALGLVIMQGLLGGMTVLLRLPRPVSIAHGCLAQLFFCSIVALFWMTSPSFQRVGLFLKSGLGLSGDRAYAVRVASAVALIAVFCQLMLGATMRHMGAGLVIGDFPKSLGRWIPPITSPEVAINFSHRVMALVVFLILTNLARMIYRERASLPAFVSRLAALMMALVTTQICLGAITVWSGRSTLPTCLHVTNGALVLATVFSLSLWVYRATGGFVGALADESGMEGAPSGMSRKDWMELCKVRLVTMAAFTAGSSFWLASPEHDLLTLTGVVVGTCLMGAGGGVLNQLVEIEIDKSMARTKNRPLATGKISTKQAEMVGGLLSITGILGLGLFIQPLSGLLAALALVSYVFVYTPMKRTSTLCTLVGAIPGALPVLVGWAGAEGRIDLGGWILFGILFLWQIPHFMAIAWLCREDYARAGLPMTTVVDPSGESACVQAICYTLALLPVSLAPSLIGMAGPVYFFIALALGMMYLFHGVKLSLNRTPLMARRLLLASVAYLPLLYGALLCIR